MKLSLRTQTEARESEQNFSTGFLKWPSRWNARDSNWILHTTEQRHTVSTKDMALKTGHFSSQRPWKARKPNAESAETGIAQQVGLQSLLVRHATLVILPLKDPAILAALAAEAMADGYRMVTRLIEEWLTGVNRFGKPGEKAYVVTLDGQVCGVGGLNIDPFADDDRVGRVRRLYIASTVRRRGVGSAVMQQIMRDAVGRFDCLHLRTHDPEASAFYEAIGFTPVTGNEHVTHQRATG